MATLPNPPRRPTHRPCTAAILVMGLVAPVWMSCGEASVAAAGGRATAAPRPDVVIIAFDGVGLDDITSLSSLPSFAATPGLDRLAAEGAVYLDAYAPSPWPEEALAAALTGMTRGAVQDDAPPTPTLAEHLAHLGYRTALFAAHDQHLLHASGTARRSSGSVSSVTGDTPPGLAGFERAECVDGADSAPGARADHVARAAIDWLVAAPGPALLVVTLADPRPPHHLYAGLVPAADVPYDGPVLSGLDHAELLRRAPSFDADDRARLAELHASEVVMADRALTQIVEAAAARRPTPPIVVAIGLRAPALGPPRSSGDAPEADAASGPGRYGLIPSTDPSDLRIPMIIRFPRAQPPTGGTPAGGSPGAGPVAGHSGMTGEIDIPVSLVDLAPTLLDALGFDPRRDFDGRSVLPGARFPDRPIVAMTTRGIRSAALVADGRAVQVSFDGTSTSWFQHDDVRAADAGSVAGPSTRGRGVHWRRAGSDPTRLEARLVQWLDRSGVLTDAERQALHD